MSSRFGERSQSWLVGEDDSLDNFFSSASSFKSQRQVSLKRKIPGDVTTGKNGSASKKVLAEAPKKRVKVHGTKDTVLRQISILDSVQGVRKERSKDSNASGSKGKARAALDNVTTSLQNSPRRRSVNNGRHMKQSLFRASPTRRKSTLKRNEDSRFVDDSLSEEEDDDDTPMRLRSPKGKQTPSRASKNDTGHLKGVLPTPPTSSAADSGRTYVNRHNSSPISSFPFSRQKNNETLLTEKTPFTFSCAPSKQSYPTPNSVAVPRLSFALPSTEKLPAPSLDLDSDSSLTPLSSEDEEAAASPAASQTEIDKDVEKRVAENADGHKEPRKNKTKPFAFVPSSQTQYIHYSPTKKNKGGRAIEFPDVRFKQPSLGMAPSQTHLSQPRILPSGSQSTYLSPRVTRKPTPLFTRGLIPPSPSKDGQGKQKPAALNFVVPTSQEDEMEISLLNGAAPSLSQLVGIASNAVATRGSEEDLCVPSPSSHMNISRVEDHNQMREDSSRSLSRMATEDYGEEEKEVSSGSFQSQSTQIRAFNAMLDDLDRLAEETRLNTTTASQVLSRRPVKASSPGKSRPQAQPLQESRRNEQEPDRYEEQFASTRSHLTLQSSITEPESSQWHEDPFALTNEAYRKHLGLKPRVSEAFQNADTHIGDSSPEEPDEKEAASISTNNTQSTATQPDEDDEDPFPMLPPVSTAESTADRRAVDNLLSLSQEHDFGSYQESPVHSPNTTSLNHSPTTPQRVQSRSEPESESEGEPMPDIGSLDDQFDMRLLSPRGVRRAVVGERVASRFRRRSDRSFVLADGGMEESQGASDSESIPSAVRDFLNMFSSQTQSQSQEWAPEACLVGSNMMK